MSAPDNSKSLNFAYNVPVAKLIPPPAASKLAKAECPLAYNGHLISSHAAVELL